MKNRGFSRWMFVFGAAALMGGLVTSYQNCGAPIAPRSNLPSNGNLPSSAPACWQTSDQLSIAGSQAVSFTRAAQSSGGGLFLGARVTGNDAKTSWVIRKGEGGLFSTVDSFQLAAGHNSTLYDVVSDSASDKIFVSGVGEDSGGVSHGIVRMIQGGVVSTIADYQYAPGFGSDLKQMLVSGGNLFVTSRPTDAAGMLHWVVRRYNITTGAWSTVDDAMNGASGLDPWGSIVSDSVGRIYVGGLIAGVATIRASTDGGQTWTSIDSYNEPGSTWNAASQIVSSADASSVYATVSNGSLNNNWIIRRGSWSGGSSTWAVADSFFNGTKTSLSRIALDSSGSVYAIGSLVDAGGISHWVIRKASGLGASFTTIDDFQLEPGKDAAGVTIAVDATGIVTASGHAKDAVGNTHWITREFAVGGGSKIVDDYLTQDFPGGLIAKPIRQFIDAPTGGFYLLGSVADTAPGTSMAIARRRVCAP